MKPTVLIEALLFQRYLTLLYFIFVHGLKNNIFYCIHPEIPFIIGIHPEIPCIVDIHPEIPCIVGIHPEIPCSIGINSEIPCIIGIHP